MVIVLGLGLGLGLGLTALAQALSASALRGASSGECFTNCVTIRPCAFQSCGRLGGDETQGSRAIGSFELSERHLLTAHTGRAACTAQQWRVTSAAAVVFRCR